MTRLAVLALFASLIIVPVAAQDPPAAAHDVLVEVPTVLAPESKAAARIVVYETKGLNKITPIEGAHAEMSLTDKEKKLTRLWAGKTGAKGVADASFTVPNLPDGDYTLTVKTSSKQGEHTAPFAVKLSRDIRILLVTDKPLYQPGQLIHLRAVAMDAMTMRAMGEQAILFEIEDAKGNKVFKKQDKTSVYGVATVDFQLADEVIMGDYKVTATVAGQRSEKSVTVKKYVLPKFKVAVKTDKQFYKPQEKVKGTIQADYFFGKPVTGEVTIKAATFDVAFRDFASTKVKTDAKGSAEFEIQLPDYFVGQPLDKGNAFVSIEVAVTDGADHTESVTKTASVCSQPLLLGAVPESGKLVPGLENVVYVLASSPDGSPVEADVELATPKQKVSGKTNVSGFVALRVTPAHDEMNGANLNVAVAAKDRQGNEAKRAIVLSSEYGKDQLLLRPGEAITRVGRSLALDLFGTFGERTVYLDVVRRGQTILTTSCELAKGRAHYDLALTADLFGSLEIHAYAFMGDAHVVRDSRVVFVQPASDLQIDVTADQPQYVPGQEATISFQVTAAGKGVQSALGVIVVDESVYALQEMQPGLEKIFFMLQKELLSPKFEIKWGLPLPAVLEQKAKADEQARASEAAIVLMAPVVLPERRAVANTMAGRVAQMAQKVQQIYWAMQNHIVNEKGQFWIDEGGKRAMDPKFLDRMAEKGKVPREMLTDSWGNHIQINDLKDVDPAFTFEYWAKVMSAQNVQAIFAALVQAAPTKDIAAPDILRQLADAKLLAEAQLKDYFGEPITMERLAKDDAAFARANLVRLMDNARKHSIFNRLMELAQKGSIITADHQYVADAMKQVGDFRMPEGGAYDLAALAKENAAFAAANIAKIASVTRRQALYTAIVALSQKGGFDKVVEPGAKAWQYKEGVLAALVAEKLLEEGQAKDVAGRAFDLAALAKDDPQFAADRVVGGLLRSRADQIAGWVCQRIHSGRRLQQLPEDAMKMLVDDKACKAEDLNDPWGTQYKFAPITKDRPGTLGCGLLSGKNTILSAGPDRKFDTADDLNVGAMQQVGVGYQPNYGGCVFYQPDPQIRWLAGDAGLENFEMGQMGEGGGAGGWRDRGKLAEKELRRREFAGGREPMAPPKADAPAPAGKPQRQLEELKKAKDARGDDKDHNEAEDGEGGDGPARVREYFPETLRWEPAIITDADGRAKLTFPMADTITTWRLTASAHTADGRLGSTTAGLLVFQDFFVDIDLPVSLTQNDVVSVPVAVYNYLKEKQTVTLTMQAADWFELRDDAEKKVELEPGQVRAVYYRIRAKGLGATNKLEVHAKGGKGAKDAIVRSIEIVPDGKMFETVYNGRLSGEVRHTVTIPKNSVEGASKILFKAYPGVFASVLDGLEGMLRMPGG
jgi:hypothetical protein